MNIDFRTIVARSGGQRDAFEELCCQLARRTISDDMPCTRLRGAGGDGGVEFIADLHSGQRIGWQAKYVFSVESLLDQSKSSLETAVEVHPNLTKYVICFPFDLTGPTRRGGRSGVEKIEDWKQIQEQRLVANGRTLNIEFWSAFKIRDLLHSYDTSGGIREYFFNQRVLTHQWFSDHLKDAYQDAGPRYTPDLNVETSLYKWFDAFGRTSTWSDMSYKKISTCRKMCKRLASESRETSSDTDSPKWPAAVHDEPPTLLEDMERTCRDSDRIIATYDAQLFSSVTTSLESLLERLRSVESELAIDLETKHGEGMADSPGFRQFMAEYMASFPTGNLDTIRDVISSYSDLYEWLLSPSCALAFDRVFVLSGAAGSGKTHGVCDVARARHVRGFRTCVVFGHQFGGEPDPWTRLLETLNLSATLRGDGFLDMLDAAGAASGAHVLLCIDAINDTRPLRYWRDRLLPIVQSAARRLFVRVCFTCRSPFISVCIPKSNELRIVEHEGFTGIEHYACRSFFDYYNLDPPVVPVLHSEFSNPLYLRLVCETMRSSGRRSLPTGWHGIAPAIRGFLDEKERQFAADHDTSPGSQIIRGSLVAIIRKIAKSGRSDLAWSDAENAITERRSFAANLPVLEWLVRSDLLIEDVSSHLESLDVEPVVRPAFERLADFLIAHELLKEHGDSDVRNEDLSCGSLCSLVTSKVTVAKNSGVLSALSVVGPEFFPGFEITGLTDDKRIRRLLLEIFIKTIPSRDPATFGVTSETLVREALGTRDLSFETMDSVLALSWHVSAIDAFWLHELLMEQSMAKRDSYWCAYLHDSFEKRGSVYRLVQAAFELPLDQLEQDVAERWIIALLWFTAATDRRVKDRATRSIVAVFSANPCLIERTIIRILLESDDDEVRERALLSGYGALIKSRDPEQSLNMASALLKAIKSDPKSFQNAMIRDHVRCIFELSAQLKSISHGVSYKDVSMTGSEWPLVIPSNDETKMWEKLLHFWPDEYRSDFFKYSMGCLRPWEHSISRSDMAKWMIKRIATDFRYVSSGCERYDRYMLGKFGGGRSKPKWAERIGKKYQWLAMYQIASRLHDNVERQKEPWDHTPDLPAPPLILLEERKLDPTLPRQLMDHKDVSDSWWVATTADLGLNRTPSDEDWVRSKQGVPNLSDFLTRVASDSQEWLPLLSFPTWEKRPEDESIWETSYRQVWIHVKSYLVSIHDVESVYKGLRGRNFFGQWLPNGADLPYGFAGEYPWATSFKNELDSWYGSEDSIDGMPWRLEPCWNQLVVEWEYDSSLEKSHHMAVPARLFFSSDDLWWDGKDGYRVLEGRTVFRDPSLTDGGPTSLMVDANELNLRLNDLKLGIIWTLLGEKWIVGGRHSTRRSRRSFSQVAYRKCDGSTEVGELTFFDDFDASTGPRAVEPIRK